MLAATNMYLTLSSDRFRMLPQRRWGQFSDSPRSAIKNLQLQISKLDQERQRQQDLALLIEFKSDLRVVPIL